MKVLAACAALLTALAARAQDPRHRFLTLETPHFQVHYHQGEYRLASRVARVAELAHARLAPLLEHEPRERCQIVVTDQTDFSNGSATPLLYDTIRVFAAPPDPRSTLNDFDEWLWELLSHEYTHILHLDTVEGIPDAANRIFGKLWIPNGGQPSWFIEGLAVYEESLLSGSGRVRSSQEEMAVRAEILERGFPRIDRLSNLPLDWPRGNRWYAIGGRFLDWVGARYGAGAVRDLSHDFGGRAVPLGLNLSASKVLGKSYLDLYEEFAAEETEKARATAAAARGAGETAYEPLTRLGERTASPRFSRDGRTLFYASAGPDRRPELRALPLLAPCCSPDAPFTGEVRRGDVRVVQTFGADRLAVAAGGRLVYARPEVFQEFAEVEDLYAVGADGEGEERLTRGLRASEPDAAADGALVFTLRRSGGRTAIALLEPSAREPRVLFEDPEGEPVGSPRFSPAGDNIVFTRHRSSSWRLALLRRDGGPPVELTPERAISRDPVFSPDGRYVLFSSDRGGIYDLYALRLADRRLLRITRMVTGAFDPEPSPDSSQIAFVTYSARGYDLARIPYAPALWTEATEVAERERKPAAIAPVPPEELYPVRSYDPLPTLLPHYWLPFAATDAQGTTLGAFTSGFDVVGRHEYAAFAWFGLSSHLPGWSASYTAHVFRPDLTLTTFGDLVSPAGLAFNTERQVGIGAFATVPFTTLERSLALRAGYTLTHLAADQDPFGLAPPDGNVAAADLSASFSDARRFVRSVSAEEGRRATLTFRVADRALGSDFGFRQLSLAVSQYLALPWESQGRPLHHVLAARLSGGVAKGDLARRHLFELGGFDEGNLVQAVVNPAAAPIRLLRGFRAGSFAGEVYALGTLEYRFPLVEVERGFWTLPLYLRRLHAALFSDGGDAFNPFDEQGPYRALQKRPFHLHLGAGAELRLETVLGYVLPADVRLGCARGIESSVYAILDCYAALGGVF